MSSMPPVGSIVTHQNCSPETLYTVVSHESGDIMGLKSHWVIVKYRSGRVGHMEVPAYTNGWTANPQFLTLAFPVHLRLPEGV